MAPRILDGEACLYVRRLQLTNFRSYHALELSLEPGRLLFMGDNAQGKSNLLEAVYLLASGRSPRAGTDAEMIGWQAEAEPQPFARLQTSVEGRAGEVQLETLVVGPSPTPAPGAATSRGGKRFRVNGIPRRSVDYVGQLRAVLFTADDLEIISGPPATRRSYLDGSLSQVDRGYHAALQRYTHVMQQRNATLRRIKEGMAGLDELSLWDDGFTNEGGVLIATRQRAIRRLAQIAATAHTELAGAAGEYLSFTYQPQLGDEWKGMLAPDADAASAAQLFRTALASQRRRETAAGLSLVGPHRDEVLIELNGVSAASFGSRAQIRTAALSLRLAEARLLRSDGDDPPVLLLDDIVSELDERRRRSVLEGVEGFEQVWFTATSGSSLPEEFVSGAQSFEVTRGFVTEM